MLTFFLRRHLDKYRNLLIEFVCQRSVIEKECFEFEGVTLDEVLLMSHTVEWTGPMNKPDSRNFVYGEIVDIEDCKTYCEFTLKVTDYIDDFKRDIRRGMAHYYWIGD